MEDRLFGSVDVKKTLETGLLLIIIIVVVYNNNNNNNNNKVKLYLLLVC